MPFKILFATNNKGKLGEVRAIFGSEFEIISLLECEEKINVIEDGNSFEENAFKKAKTVFDKFKIPVIADDSGLCVDQLNGQPGIYSSRFAGEDSDDEKNIVKLFELLKNFPEPHYAKFICSAVYLDENLLIKKNGEMRGRIINEKRGFNGFGYDPVFIADNYSLTNAELPPEEKNKISHRAKAFGSLKNSLLNSRKA